MREAMRFGCVVAVLTWATSFATPPSAATSSLAHVLGYYSTPSSLCTVIEENTPQPCDPPDTDWLRIEAVDASHATIEVYSVQKNGDQCEVRGIASWDGHSLVYKDSDAKSDDYGHGFRIKFGKHTITFSYLLQSDALGAAPFCGAQASLERLVFPLT